MSAKDALELASQKWGILPIEEIFKKIEDEASRGYRRALFSRAHINGEQLLTLQELGYKVEIYENSSSDPYFFVYW